MVPTRYDFQDLGTAGKADLGEACRAALKLSIASAPTTLRSTDAPSAARAAAAAAAGELPDFLRNWRKELRHEHCALEEDRRLWRCEARRVKRATELVGAGSKGSEELEILSEVRTALDARAAQLNSSIGEYRALERLHATGPLRRSSSQRAHSGGASRGPGGSRKRSSSTSAVGSAVPLAMPGMGEGLASAKHVLGEEDLMRRWHHVLQPQQGAGFPEKGRRSSSRTAPPLSGRAALLEGGLHSASALRAGVGGG